MDVPVEVVTAVVQYVCKAAVLAGEATHAQLGGESNLETGAEAGAEAELAAATALLQAIIAQEPASHLSQSLDLEAVMMVKPAVLALTAWMAGHQQLAAAEVPMDPGRSVLYLVTGILASTSWEQDLQDQAGLVDWDAVLEVVTTLIENNPSYQRQASNAC
ncbi:MAG: hypothetical protein FRX49_06631 [Trebouxia sp. A1-2]|nr:MAG: hypothetical protein FRX49_06631 [Trebouxia sp. A1-2]